MKLFAFRGRLSTSVKEKDLHERFKSKRVLGEWFNLDVLDYVELLKEWDYDPGVHFSERGIEIIQLEATAYISFDSRSLCEVKVLKYDIENNKASVEVLKKIGSGVGNIGDVYGLFADEIRQDPIDALINRITM